MSVSVSDHDREMFAQCGSHVVDQSSLPLQVANTNVYVRLSLFNVYYTPAINNLYVANTN